jgi:hypothetical protein
VNDAATQLDCKIEEIAEIINASAVNASVGRRQRLQQVVRDLVPTLTKLAERPDEPTDAHVVTFTKNFRGTAGTFDYAAIKAGNGYWYRTGTEARYTWDQLLDFIGGEHVSSLRYSINFTR